MATGRASARLAWELGSCWADGAATGRAAACCWRLSGAGCTGSERLGAALSDGTVCGATSGGLCGATVSGGGCISGGDAMAGFPAGRSDDTDASEATELSNGLCGDAGRSDRATAFGSTFSGLAGLATCFGVISTFSGLGADLGAAFGSGVSEVALAALDASNPIRPDHMRKTRRNAQELGGSVPRSHPRSSWRAAGVRWHCPP